MRFEITILSGESRLLFFDTITEKQSAGLKREGWQYTQNADGQAYFYKENDIEFSTIFFYPWGKNEIDVSEQHEIERTAAKLHEIEKEKVSEILEMHS